MHRFEFADEVRQALAREQFGHLDPRMLRRMEILGLKSHGETHQRIAELAGMSRRTVERVLDLHVAGGLGPCGRFMSRVVPTRWHDIRRRWKWSSRRVLPAWLPRHVTASNG